MTTMTLPKQSFLALAAIGWADGSLQKIEATGLLRAAKECGVGDDDLPEIERATKQKIALDAIHLNGMDQWQQVLTYALASWFASLDGVASTDERDTLAQLGEALGLDKPLRVRAAAAANDIACLPEGGRPERFDFVKLAARLRERLPQIAAAK
jgi:tellurite resistance protein